ncbi:MAG: aminotransferase class I/II-fold pyridoxal phosphate-dependent enzyme, partial [Halioglobus sp.]
MHIEQLSPEDLAAEQSALEESYLALGRRQLSLDLTRGKPSTEQVSLSNALDGILAENFVSESGIDVRNYGGLDGLEEAKRLFSNMLGVNSADVLIGGNSSLTLMYTVVELALSVGLDGSASAWGNSEEVKFLCPVPGYDRHFAICEHLGIEMIPVPMLETGPDMDTAERLVKADNSIKGIWCVPRFSNPTGCVYSDSTVERLAALGKIAGDHFVVMYDNAYAVHALHDKAPALANISDYCAKHDTANSVFQFGSTSKITFAGAGVAFLSSGASNLAALRDHLSFQSIGPDKVNQLR